MNEYSYPNNDMRTSNAMMGFLVGAVVGAGIALLLAPATGEETRHKLGGAARRLRQTAGDTLDRAKTAVNEFKEDARSAVETGRESFRRGTQPTEAGRTT